MEHVSHHPPISCLLMEDVEGKFKYNGSVELTASLGANHLKAGQEGNQYVTYTDNNQKIVFTCPKYTLGGTVMGDRTINIDHAFIFEDLTFGYKAVVIFNPITKSGGLFSSHTYAGKSDEFRGLVYIPNKKKEANDKFKKIKDINDVKKELCEIEGSWLRDVKFNGETYWTIDGPEFRPERAIPTPTALPSDWRYREDLIWLYRNNMDYADAWKVR